MKIYFSLLLLLSAFSVKAQTNAPVIVDGVMNEWNSPLQNYDDGAEIAYSITHDREAFYLGIRATDERTMMRIARLGFKIALDPTGKKKEKYILTYKPELVLPSRGAIRERPGFEKMRSDFNQKPVELSLSGFKGIPNKKFRLAELPLVEFAMNWDEENNLNMEYKIPYSAVGYIPGGNDVSFGITLLAFEMPSGMQPSLGGGMGGDPSRMGGSSGAGDGAGRMGGRMAEMASEKVIWYKYTPGSGQ